jgi:eukaryotic-like serine/threonine-protein kinase
MSTNIERRMQPRNIPQEHLLSIMQAKGLACNIDSCAQDNLYVFVDVMNCSECGILVQVPFQLSEGTIVNLALPDDDTGTWATQTARIIWTRRNAANNFCTGLEYLGGNPVATSQMEWEVDPQKPSPADLSFLMQASFFQAIPRTELCFLLNTLHKTLVSAGERLISRGEPGECLYLIQKGVCCVFVELDGQVRRIAKLKAGNVVGEMSVLTGEPRTANVDAETDMVLWKLAGSQFDALAESHPDLRLFLTEIMSNRFDSSVFVGDRTIGKYVLSNKIGKGGWGIVYRGMHKLLKMPVAIKMMKHDMAMEPEFLKNFRQEAETIARMRHPNIVSVYDIEEVYRTIFIIMEYLEGISLEDHLDKGGPLPPERCADILLQICSGLECAHKYDIVHRDIKPGNIFLLENDQVKLLDFGLACAPGTEDLDIAGTVYYAPPEQIEGRPVDFRADLYSLGIMAFEMVVGERPYPESNLAELMDMHCNVDIPDPREFVPDLPQQLRDFVVTCCKRDPDMRYRSAMQAREILLPLSLQRPESRVSTSGHERGVTSLLLIHTPEQQQALKELLEEFGDKAAELGVNLLLSEFNKV